MSNKKLKIKLFLISITLVLSFPLDAQESHHNWQRLGGKWKINNSKAVEERAWCIPWGYYELVNYNTILSLKPYENFSSIEVNAELFDREESPTEFILSFDITSESLGWFYHMYAFRITGGFWGMDKVSFIHSDRTDKTKPFNTKNNTFIKELASADCKIKYKSNNNYRIEFENDNATLYINDKRILSAPLLEKNYNGRIAISSKNTKIAIDKITVKKKNQIIFQDDFNIDSIFVKVVKAIKVPETNENNDKATKP